MQEVHDEDLTRIQQEHKGQVSRKGQPLDRSGVSKRRSAAELNLRKKLKITGLESHTDYELQIQTF